jgi:hypothetical protein
MIHDKSKLWQKSYHYKISISRRSWNEEIKHIKWLGLWSQDHNNKSEGEE